MHNQYKPPTRPRFYVDNVPNMPPLSLKQPTPEQIRRETKVNSLTKYLCHELQIDRMKLQDSFNEYTIVDFSFRSIYEGGPLHSNLLARLKISDAIAEDFFGDNEPWVRCEFTSVLILKEYAEKETRARISHERYACILVQKWPKPDVSIQVMYPIADPRSERQKDYLLRAFTVQLGAAVLEKFYDEELQEALVDVDDHHPTSPCCLQLLKILIATLERSTHVNTKRRVLVALHGARVSQVVELLDIIYEIAADWMAPIFMFLISGQGADVVAEQIGCGTFEMPWPDEYHVQLNRTGKVKQGKDGARDTNVLKDSSARSKWKMQGGWQCQVWRRE